MGSSVVPIEAPVWESILPFPRSTGGAARRHACLPVVVREPPWGAGSPRAVRGARSSCRRVPADIELAPGRGSAWQGRPRAYGYGLSSQGLGNLTGRLADLPPEVSAEPIYHQMRKIQAKLAELKVARDLCEVDLRQAERLEVDEAGLRARLAQAIGRLDTAPPEKKRAVFPGS